MISFIEVAMDWLEAALVETTGYPYSDDPASFCKSIDPAWIEQALELTGTVTVRRRRLPAEQVIWLVLGMALLRDRAIKEVVKSLDLALPKANGDSSVASSAISQARKRVGEAPLAWLFERTASHWAHQSAAAHRWRDLAVYAVDGTTLRVADSDENREHFGLVDGGDRGESGYPVVRLSCLIAARSHLLAAADFGPYGQSEKHYAESLWKHIPDHSLTILDRIYQAAAIQLGIERGGQNRHWLMRARKGSKWTVLRSFGRFDKLVEITVTRQARVKAPSLPRTFTARALSYKHSKSKERQWLLTSLTEADKYPAKEVVAMYHERWESELAYKEIKSHLLERQETIRSKTVQGVRQELWGILITFNLIRLEMERIAEEASVEPIRVSFTASMHFIRVEWEYCAIASPGTIPAKLKRMRRKIQDFILPPRRSERSYPRAVKVKMSNYKRKRRKPKKAAPK